MRMPESHAPAAPHRPSVVNTAAAGQTGILDHLLGQDSVHWYTRV